jgi:hypothetical protein
VPVIPLQSLALVFPLIPSPHGSGEPGFGLVGVEDAPGVPYCVPCAGPPWPAQDPNEVPPDDCDEPPEAPLLVSAPGQTPPAHFAGCVPPWHFPDWHVPPPQQSASRWHIPPVQAQSHCPES